MTAVLLAIGLSGCIQADNNTNAGDITKFIGTWELQPYPGSDPNDLTTYIFYQNGSLVSTFIDYDGENHTGWADYSLENGKVCMKTHPHGAITDDDYYCYDYEFSQKNTQLTLSTNELPTATLNKIQN